MDLDDEMFQYTDTSLTFTTLLSFSAVGEDPLVKRTDDLKNQVQG